MGKTDLYGHKQRYISWKKFASEKGYIEEELTKANSDILIRYIFDMEIGANVSNRNVKGARSYPRLNNIRQRLAQILRMMQERGINDITEAAAKEREIVSFFSDMKEGRIKTSKGQNYKSAADYAKIFKAFWHWYQKVRRKKYMNLSDREKKKTKESDYLLPDITEDLDVRRDMKPRWVYLDEEQVNKALEKAEPKYKPLLAFLFDSGARPTEALSLTKNNVSQDNKGNIWLDIPNEVSKTFGRKIKLMLCGKDLLNYIEESEMEDSDLLFPFSAPLVNRYLNQLGKELFGEGISKAGEKYSKLTMYDLRHCSCCYWVSRYKSESALKYRFGWLKSDMVHYYHEFLGMKDPIRQEDLYVDITKTELEKEIGKLKTESSSQQKKIAVLVSEYKTVIRLLMQLNVISKKTLEKVVKNDKSKAGFKKYLGEIFPEGKAIYPLVTEP